MEKDLAMELELVMELELARGKGLEMVLGFQILGFR